jgi:hypothetical protein
MQFMWHCSEKSSSPINVRAQGICARNPGKPEKVLPFKAVRRTQTLYMTDRMFNDGKHVTGSGRAFRLLGA